MGAVKEANQGFAHRIDPCAICSYEVDCEDIVDLRTAADRDAAGVRFEDMSCAWMDFIAQGERPPSWIIHDRLSVRAAGVVVSSFVSSFVSGADQADHNLVLWHWTASLPRKVDVFDPSGRLSWS